MAKRLSIVLGIVLLTVLAAGGWVYMNQDAIFGTEEVASVDAEPEVDPNLPTAERNLGRLSKHFKQAPVIEEKKDSGWF